MGTTHERLLVVGGGSFPTALVKLLAEKASPTAPVAWWVRDPEVAHTLQHTGLNPRYLPAAHLPAHHLALTTDLAAAVAQADHLLLAVPSAYLHATLQALPPTALNGKAVLSTIKGFEQTTGQVVTRYLAQRFPGIGPVAMVTGPCHAEELAERQTSYLHVLCDEPHFAAHMAHTLRCSYLHTSTGPNPQAAEYAAVLKNIYAIGAGMATGLGYRANFLAVLVAAAIKEMLHALTHIHNLDPAYFPSFYVGDLLVTAYSEHSRNRRLGEWIGTGLTPQEAIGQMRMVAEGFHSTRIYAQANALDGHPEAPALPILRAVNAVLHHGADTRATFLALEGELR